MTILADQGVQLPPYQFFVSLQDRTRRSGSAGLSSVFHKPQTAYVEYHGIIAEVPL